MLILRTIKKVIWCRGTIHARRFRGIAIGSNGGGSIFSPSLFMTTKFCELLERVIQKYAISEPEKGVYRVPINTQLKKFPQRTGDDILIILNPLKYATKYHERYAAQPQDDVRCIFWGMEPSPKSPTGVAFYDMELFDSWLGPVILPHYVMQHAPCEPDMTSEAGKRFYRQFVLGEFGSLENFFKHCIVFNYCPLIMMRKRMNKNGELVNMYVSRQELYNLHRRLALDILEPCNVNLHVITQAFRPKLMVGVGGEAFKRAKPTGAANHIPVIKMRHPSRYTNMQTNADVSYGDTVKHELNIEPEWRRFMDSYAKT